MSKDETKIEFPMWRCKSCECVFNLRDADSIEVEEEIETVDEDSRETYKTWNGIRYQTVRIECPICGYLNEIKLRN